MKHVALDLDDFSVLNNHMDILMKVKEHFPEFKISLFTIPFDYVFEQSVMRALRPTELEKVKAALPWIQIIPHGVTHMPREFENCDKHSMDMIIENINEIFERDHLPFEKGFKAPYWLWNHEVVESLNEHGWWGAVDRNNPEMHRPHKYYEYTYSLEEPFWEAKEDTLLLHGHMDLPSKNNLGDCWANLLKLPSDTVWHFVTDYIKEDHENTRLS